MPHISIIIATFNSSKLLPSVVASIKKQNYPQDKIEILVIDGGSSDNTTKIAESFGCKVIINEKVQPLYAKYLGYIHAKGKYIMYLDHDEIIENPHSLAIRYSVFLENKNVMALTGDGYVNPKDYGIINSYINEFGDPFSFFIYKLSKNKNFYLSTMKKRFNVTKDNNDYVIFDISGYKNKPIIELIAAGGMFDLSYCKRNLQQILKNYDQLAHVFYLIIKKYPKFSIVKNDSLVHYSSNNIRDYINKINWRIKNNLFYDSGLGSAGFKGRQGYENKLFFLKKFLYIPYALSIIMPFLDAIFLIFTRSNFGYIIHVPLTFYTALSIVYFTFLKEIGFKPYLTSYDGKVRAYENKS